MLDFVIPDDSRTAELLAYRSEVLRGRGSFAGTAGMGDFSDPGEWLEQIALLASEKAERYGWLRTLVFLAYDGGSLCGVVNLRLSEEESVTRQIGHIGYHVRSSCRRRGYGTEMLRFAAELARKNGIAEPVVCTAADNLPSQKTALSAGFVPDGEEALPNGETIRRFRMKSAWESVETL